MQRGSYVEMCTKALVSQPDASVTLPVFESGGRSAPPRFGRVSSSHPQSIFTNAETLYVGNRVCIICASTDSVVAVMANPFAIRCYVGVCRACLSSNGDESASTSLL